MVVLRFKDLSPHGFKLRAPLSEFEDAEDLKWNVAIEENFTEVGAVLNSKGEITAFDVEFVINSDIVKDIVAYVERNLPHGLYTIPELGLKNVPFDVVIEKVKEYYEREWREICKKFNSLYTER